MFDTVEPCWDSGLLEGILDQESPPNPTACLAKVEALLHATTKDISFLPSARDGLSFILRSINTSAKYVLVPSFNCPAVFTAIRSAGLKVLTYDFTNAVGTFDWSKTFSLVEPGNIAAIVVTYYFGISYDISLLVQYSQQYNIPIIEDCAHCFGASFNNHIAGSIGAAAIYSFNYDKPITLGFGGLLRINDYRFFKDEFAMPSYYIPSLEQEYVYLQNFLSYLAFRKASIKIQSNVYRKLYTIYSRLRSRQISPHLPVYGIGPLRLSLLSSLLDLYPSVRNTRNQNYYYISSSLKYPSWPISSKCNPSLIKLKVNLLSPLNLSCISSALLSHGFRAGNYNWPWQAIQKEPSSNHHYSFEAANQWIDVPIHQNLTRQSINTIIHLINNTNS